MFIIERAIGIICRVWLVTVETFFSVVVYKQGRASHAGSAQRACAFRAVCSATRSAFTEPSKITENARCYKAGLEISVHLVAGRSGASPGLALLAMALSTMVPGIGAIKSCISPGWPKVECRGAVFSLQIPNGWCWSYVCDGFSLRQQVGGGGYWWCQCLRFRFVWRHSAPCCGNPMWYMFPAVIRRRTLQQQLVT